MDAGKIQMVALDLDGTTYTDDKRITARTRAAISDAIQAGILVVPATGRPAVGLPEELMQIPGIRYALTSNGAAVYDAAEQRMITNSCMSPELVLQLMKCMQDIEATFELYIDGQAYASEAHMKLSEQYVPDAHIREYVRKTRTVVPDLRAAYEELNCGVEKINMSFGSAKEQKRAYEILTKVDGIVLVSGLDTNIEINRADVNKGSGLLQFASAMGISREAIMACGDSSNDVEMLKAAGLGIAMANAKPEAKDAADYTLTLSNEEEGVAAILEELVKAESKAFRFNGAELVSIERVHALIAETLGITYQPDLDGLYQVLLLVAEPIDVTITNLENVPENMLTYVDEVVSVFALATEENEYITLYLEEIVITEDFYDESE